MKIIAKTLRTVTDEQLDQILERTEYLEKGIALGVDAIQDHDLRCAAQKEIAHRDNFYI